MNICNLCAVVGINKRIHAKQLHGICIILSIKLRKYQWGVAEWNWARITKL
jgi:hypothetical protein